MLPLDRRLRRWATPAVALVLLAAALLVLRRELHAVRYHDVSLAVRGLPRGRLLLALVLTACAYAVLPWYDGLALAYAGRRLPLKRVGFGSVIAYGLSQTLGFPLLTGGSVRWRLWSAWGLSTTEIAQALSFAGATFTLGLVTVTSAALVLEPHATAALLPLVPPWALRCAGLGGMLLVAAYLTWSVRRRGVPFRVRGWEFPVPGPGIATLQLAIAVADWTLAALVLRVLLPTPSGPTAEIGFGAFLAAFMVGQGIGIASHVPGGLGVFEMVMVLALAPAVPPERTLGALLAFRVIYYLLPFVVALAMLAGHEVARQRQRVQAVAARTRGLVARWGPALLPHALSLTTFLGGCILLFSGATPSAHGRVATLTAVLPLGLVELSHLAGSVAGAGLIVLAWAIRRRLDAAYGLTVALLVVGIVASLL